MTRDAHFFFNPNLHLTLAGSRVLMSGQITQTITPLTEDKNPSGRGYNQHSFTGQMTLHKSRVLISSSSTVTAVMETWHRGGRANAPLFTAYALNQQEQRIFMWHLHNSVVLRDGKDGFFNISKLSINICEECFVVIHHLFTPTTTSGYSQELQW